MFSFYHLVLPKLLCDHPCEDTSDSAGKRPDGKAEHQRHKGQTEKRRVDDQRAGHVSRYSAEKAAQYTAAVVPHNKHKQIHGDARHGIRENAQYPVGARRADYENHYSLAEAAQSRRAPDTGEGHGKHEKNHVNAAGHHPARNIERPRDDMYQRHDHALDRDAQRGHQRNGHQVEERELLKEFLKHRPSPYSP